MYVRCCQILDLHIPQKVLLSNRVTYPTTVTVLLSFFLQGAFQAQLGWCREGSVVCIHLNTDELSPMIPVH